MCDYHFFTLFLTLNWAYVLLFLLYLNNLPENIQHQVRLFADNTSVYVTVSNSIVKYSSPIYSLVPAPRSTCRACLWRCWCSLYYLYIFLYSGDHIWSLSEVSVLEFWKKGLLAESFRWVPWTPMWSHGARLFQLGIVLAKKNTSGLHYKSGACNTASCVMTW